MKKVTILILSLLCIAGLMTGCGQESEDKKIMQKVFETTTWENMIETYGSARIDYELPENISFYTYMDSETFLETNNERSYAFLFSPEESCDMGLFDDGTPYFDRFVNIFDEDMSAVMRSDSFLFLTGNEVLVSMTEENGVLSFETKCGTNDISAEVLEASGLDMADGDYYVCKYKADAETYRLLESSEYILRADGTEKYIGTITIQVGVERPTDFINELAARGNEIDALPEEQTRVVYLVLDPETENERTVFQKVVRGDLVLLPYDMHGYEVYMDPEGTKRKADDPEAVALDVPSSTYYLIKSE